MHMTCRTEVCGGLAGLSAVAAMALGAPPADAAPRWTDHLLAFEAADGTLAGSCRAEGAPETPQALGDAGRTNLTVHLYDHADHDLNWTLERARTGGPPAFHEAFDVMARLVGR